MLQNSDQLWNFDDACGHNNQIADNLQESGLAAILVSIELGHLFPAILSEKQIFESRIILYNFAIFH